MCQRVCITSSRGSERILQKNHCIEWYPREGALNVTSEIAALQHSIRSLAKRLRGSKRINGLAVAEPASFSRVTLIRNKYSMRPLHKTIGKRFVNTTCFVSSQLINISCDVKY